MAIPWRKVLEILPRIALSALPGLVQGGRMSQILNAAAGKNLKGATFTYPAMTSDFYYPMVADVRSTVVNGRKTKLPALNFPFPGAPARSAEWAGTAAGIPFIPMFR